MIQHVVEPRPLVSAILEAPEIVMGVPWSFLLTVVRDRIQGSAILTAVSRYDADYIGIWTHNDSGVTCWDTSPFVVGDNAGDEISPSVEVES